MAPMQHNTLLKVSAADQISFTLGAQLPYVVEFAF